MNWSKKKVLITGAGGFIGSHLTEYLVKRDAKVRVFLRYTSKREIGNLGFLPKQMIDKIDIVFGDIREIESIKEAMKDREIVFHLAALVGIPYSYIHPQEVFEVNTVGSINIFNAARELGTKRIVHTSTSEVYGTAQYIPMDEKHPLQPQSPYSASKIAADATAISYFKAFNLPVSIIRPFNTYGPRQSDRAIIPTIISQALWKKEIRLGNIFPTRDYTYVAETVDGFIKVASSKYSIGEIINIGSGYEVSIKDIICKVSSILGKRVKIVQEKQRQRPERSEVNRLYADNSKAKKLIGWQARVSLEEGLKSTIEWIARTPGAYKPDRYNR